jgi:hypothetical protein
MRTKRYRKPLPPPEQRARLLPNRGGRSVWMQPRPNSQAEGAGQSPTFLLIGFERVMEER